jgi:hypothetical protein
MQLALARTGASQAQLDWHSLIFGRISPGDCIKWHLGPTDGRKALMNRWILQPGCFHSIYILRGYKTCNFTAGG